MSKDLVSSIREFFETEVKENQLIVLYLGYSGIMLKTLSKVVAIDIDDLIPKKGIDEIKKLDLLLFTHSHYDHFDKGATLKLYKKIKPKVVCEEKVYNSLKGKIEEGDLLLASPGSSLEVSNIKIEVIKGVHIGPIVLYLIEINNLRIFHGGDSAYVPLYPRKADVAIVPTGDPSPTASPDDAYRMVLDLQPHIAIPIHGSEYQHREFEEKVKKQIPNIRVEFIEKGEVKIIEV